MGNKTIHITNTQNLQKRALLWACKHYKYVFQFRNNGYENGFENLLFASNQPLVFNNLEGLANFTPTNKHCGFLNYDLKNDIEVLKSENKDSFNFPLISFIKAEVKLSFSNSNVRIEASNPEKKITQIINTKFISQPKPEISFNPQTLKNEYLDTLSKLKKHIVEGDIYEACYCIEFLSEKIKIASPEYLFNKLCKENPKPFSSFVKYDKKYLLGTSPERFIKNKNNKITSQPIKGTIKRGNSDHEDDLLKNKLFNDSKERSENLMIVDLVRNDLSRISNTGSVKVDELFGIYTYPTVHQMISTITSELKPNLNFADILHATFPMGSMTGAPKIKAMELIDQYENFSRGLYSGSVGYFTPNGFDFNVVIRTIQYANKQLGIHVGSAITFDSSAEKEYKECLLKANALFKLFN